MRRSSLAFHLVASAAVWCALVLSGAGFLLSALVGDTVESTFDARLGVLLEGLVAGSELGPDGKLVLRAQLGEPRFTQPLSGWYWQIGDPDHPLERSSSLWDQTLALPPAARDRPATDPWTGDVAGPEGQSLRLLVRAITLPDAKAPLLFAVAGDRAEIRAQRQRFDRLLSLALGGLFLGLLGALLLQVRIALAPLRRIQAGLAAIRAGRARRLEGRLPAELQPLAQELNALLEYGEALIERARTHVGNLAHGLKTPLAVLHNEAERSDGALATLVGRQVDQMRRLVDHHLARARAMATGQVLGARTEVLPVLADLARTLERIHANKHAGGRSRSRSPARPASPSAAPVRTSRRCSATCSTTPANGPPTRSGSRPCARPAASWSRSRTTARACPRSAAPWCSSAAAGWMSRCRAPASGSRSWPTSPSSMAAGSPSIQPPRAACARASICPPQPRPDRSAPAG